MIANNIKFPFRIILTYNVINHISYWLHWDTNATKHTLFPALTHTHTPVHECEAIPKTLICTRRVCEMCDLVSASEWISAFRVSFVCSPRHHIKCESHTTQPFPKWHNCIFMLMENATILCFSFRHQSTSKWMGECVRPVAETIRVEWVAVAGGRWKCELS